MIEIKNEEIFGKVIADALVAVDSNSSLPTWEKIRWSNAIGKAVRKLEDLAYQFEWMKNERHLLVWSDSNEIYEANGTCQCTAYIEFNQACWHRALAKLIKNYLLEVENEIWAGEILEEKVEEITYLKQPTGAKPMKVGNIRI